MSIFDNGTKIGYRNSGNGYAGYGSKLITKGKHEWIVKFTSNNNNFEIGIMSSFDNRDTEIYTQKNSIGYYTTNIQGWLDNGSSYKTLKSGVKSIQSGDTIKIILDIKKNYVAFYNNNTLLYETNNLPNTNGWRLACYGGWSNKECLEIISSKSDNVIDIVDLNDIINTLKTSSNNLKNDNNKIINELKLFELNDLLNTKTLIESYKNNSKILNDLILQYNKQINNLETMVNKQIKPDPNNYENWSAKEICRFIVTLEDGKFKKYGKTLEKSLIENEVNGSEIKDITKNDLIPFGITKFGDRTAIHKHLINLVNNKEGSDTNLI